MSSAASQSAPVSSAAEERGQAVAAVPERRGQRRKRVLLAAGAALLAFVGIWYLLHRGLESTDDAQTDAEIVAVPARVGGTVAKVLFEENQSVQEGQPLAQLDDEMARAKLAQAEASLAAAQASADAADAEVQLTETNAVGNKSVAEAGLVAAAAGVAATQNQVKEAEAQVQSAQAKLEQAKTERDHSRSLFANGSISKTSIDDAETAYSLAEAALQAAQARLASLQSSTNQARGRVAEASARAKQSGNVSLLVEQARARAEAAQADVKLKTAARDLAALELRYTTITAPHDGVVSKKTIAEGQTVMPGQTVVQLVPPKVWVTANFKETQIGAMHPGQPVKISVDAYPSLELNGQVDSISGATGARFSLLPPDNASGNFTKVVQRVPVRVELQDPPQGVVLRPGMSVELTVDTR